MKLAMSFVTWHQKHLLPRRFTTNKKSTYIVPPRKERAPQSIKEDRGNGLICSLCEQGIYCILDVRVTYTDVNTYKYNNPYKVLESAEKIKKRKYLQTCTNQQHHLTPFIVYVDGLIGKEARSVINVLVQVSANNAGKPYSLYCGFLRAKLSIAIIRVTHICLRCSRIPTSHMNPICPHWEDASGIGLLSY
jgi:hypothetical protein